MEKLLLKADIHSLQRVALEQYELAVKSEWSSDFIKHLGCTNIICETFGIKFFSTLIMFKENALSKTIAKINAKEKDSGYLTKMANELGKFSRIMN